jgi:hypothetical protein
VTVCHLLYVHVHATAQSKQSPKLVTLVGTDVWHLEMLDRFVGKVVVGGDSSECRRVDA